MANYFQEDEARPIVSAWVEQGFEIDRGFILEAIEADEAALSHDVTISAVAAFGSIASGCLMLALAGFSAPMLIPVGVVVGAGLVAWNSDCAKGDRELEGKFLRDYPAVFDRINQRVNSGEGVAKIAGEYGQMFRAYRKSDRAALAQITATASAETTAQSGIQNGDASNAPRTESAALAPTELQPIAPGLAAAAPSMQHIVSPVWNPAQDLGENPQSALIVGVPGSGKGMMVSNAIRVLKSKVPNLKVFVIDPKASPKERGYWTSIADEYRAFSLKNCEDPDEGAAWLLSCMDAFRRLPGPKLCIFDELMTAATELELSDSKMKALPKLKKFVVGLVGQGDSEAEWLWAMTQSPQVKDLGMSGGVRANLRVIGLVSPKNMTAVEALVSTQLIPKPDGGMDELRSIMAASPVGRAVFDGKIARWLPMPKLENHSGFDRDNRSLSAETSSPKTRSSAQPTDEWDGVPEVECDGPDDAQWDLIERFSQETGQGYFNNPNFDSWLKKQTYVDGKAVNVSSSSAPVNALSGQTIEVETTAIDDRPDGLDDFPLVLTIWEYLDGKDARSMKQISGAMKTGGKIPDDILTAKLGQFETYKDAIKTVVFFGVSKGYLRQVSEDAYESVRKH